MNTIDLTSLSLSMPLFKMGLNTPLHGVIVKMKEVDDRAWRVGAVSKCQGPSLPT